LTVYYESIHLFGLVLKAVQCVVMRHNSHFSFRFFGRKIFIIKDNGLRTGTDNKYRCEGI
jgi:hypothetical protein